MTERQVAALTRESRNEFVSRLRGLLLEHPVIARQTASKSPEWFDWVVETAAGVGLSAELDIAEFVAQMIARGDGYFDEPLARAALAERNNPAWVRVRHFAQHAMLVDGGDH